MSVLKELLSNKTGTLITTEDCSKRV